MESRRDRLYAMTPEERAQHLDETHTTDLSAVDEDFLKQLSETAGELGDALKS